MNSQNFVRDCLFTGLLLFGSFQANAALIALDWEQLPSGNQSLTLDTNTGFEWLDVSLSTGMTRAETEVELQLGGDFYGFSFATFGQLQTLFGSAGVSTTSGYYSDYGTIDDHLEMLVAEEFSGLVGLVSADLFFYQGLSGRFALLADGEAGGIYTYEERDPNCWVQYDGVTVFCGKMWGGLGPSAGSSGSWLVRQTVPEPGVLLLLSIGLVGLGLTRRKPKA